MERLILLCLLSPAIFAQPRKSRDPNDEPFLPVFPVYSYNPKLLKRGTEQELTTQLSSELYAPKVDAKDSYSSSYSTNYPRESHSNPDPKNSSPASAYPLYYNGNAYAYVHSPYVVYTPYAVNPAPSYPNYYYQQPYYYPNIYNHPLFPPPPPQPAVSYQETPQDSAETEGDVKQNKRGKQSKKPKENGETSQDDVPSTSQYVDGGNYISSGGGARDLDVQSSTYKLASPYNQLEGNVQAGNLPLSLPKVTGYRLINVAGQPVNPNYPLPTTYIKIQQMEQQVSQALAKLLAQQQASQSYGNHRDTLNDANGSYASQNVYNLNAAPYVTPSTVKPKSVAFVINVDGAAKVNGGQANSQGSPSQGNKSTKSGVIYVRKPAALENSQAANSKHRASDSTDEYNGYDEPRSHAGDKQKGNYYQSGSYQSKDFTVTPQASQAYSYQYSAYAADEMQQPQSQGDKIATDDSNFGAKQYNKA